MSFIFDVLLVVLASAVLTECQNLTITAETTTTPASTTTSKPFEEHDELPPPPESSGSQIPHITVTKKIPLTLLDKLDLLLRPLRHLKQSVADILNLTHHPNFGGVQLLSPQYLWEKLHEKGHGYFNGAKGSVFGTVLHPPPEYPFAYRNGDDGEER